MPSSPSGCLYGTAIRTTINLTFDLPIVVGTQHEKPEHLACGRRPEGGATWLAPVRFTRNLSSTGLTKEEAETLLNLHKQYIRLYYSCIAKRLGVDASYIRRVANGVEHQSEKLRRALLSELGLMHAAA